MRRLAGKLSYANVISTICLFLLLGGGAAYAASQIHLGKNSVGVNQLKKNAVTTAKIKSNAVTGAKVADGSLTGADIEQASLTGVRASNVTALLIGGKECAAVTPFPAGVSAERTSPGVCKITFPSSVINCATVATPHFRLLPNEVIVAGERSVQISSVTNTPNVISTATYDEGAKASYSFDLTVVC
jgi:hypothetical protein